MEGRKFGWIRDPKDPKDRMMAAHHPVITRDLPEETDLTGDFPEIFDQGQEGSCVWNATVAVEMFCQEKQASKTIEMMSRNFGYYMTRAKEGTCKEDVGCCIRNAMWIAAHFGIPHESTWPYNPDTLFTLPSFKAFREAKQHQSLEYFRVDWTDLKEVMGCLADGWPIVFGMSIYESFESATTQKSGVVPVPNTSSEKSYGGHCMVIVGYKWVGEELFFKVRNSWGDKWGQAGHCWIPAQIITSPVLSDDFWTIRKIEIG